MKEKVCIIDGCLNKFVAQGYCNKHYLRWKKYNDPLFIQHKEGCSVIECNNKHFGEGYCNKHYMRKKRTGDAVTISRKEPLFGTLRERFEKSYVINEITGCWEWCRSLFRQGYSKIDYLDEIGNRKSIRGHRLSYRLYKGEIKDNLFVCHSCDNKICVNPDHLWLGTHEDNMADMDKKGRRNSLRTKRTP